MTDMNQQTEQAQEYTLSAEKQPKSRMSKAILVRYGVVAVLVVALGVLVSLLLQSRTEAQAEPQTEAQEVTAQPVGAMQAYVPSRAAAAIIAGTEAEVERDEVITEVVIPEAQVVTSENSAENVTENAAEQSLLPTPTPMAAMPATAPAEAVTQEQQTEVGVVRGRGAVVMDSPNGQVLETLPTGNPVTASARSANSQWLYVTTPEGTVGWMEASGLVIYHLENLAVMETTGVGNNTSSAVPAAADGENISTDGEIAATVALNGSRLNVRSGPGTNYAIVAKAQPNEVFAAVARNSANTWVQIRLPDAPNEVAWVAADFITLTAPLQNLPVSNQVGSEPQANVSPAVSASSADNSVSTASAPVASAPVASGATGMQGNLIIQSGNGGNIFVYSLSSGAMRVLTTGFDPAVSPDGQTVAFARGGGEHGLYLIDLDGTNERRIYNGNELIAAPSWSPDGQWLVFRRSIGSYDCREVGFGICLPEYPFLESFPLGSGHQFGLSRVDTNGENFRDLGTATLAQAPDWNEAGIVYASHPSIEITADEPDATTRRVTAEAFFQDPDWQPNGGRIAFQSKRGDHWEIFAVNPDGSGQVALTRPVTTLVDELPDNVAPAWSPDGQYIVYLSSRDAENDQGPWRIWVMNADGTNQHPLPVELDIQYNFANEQAVSWGR